jgi:hypothetical protein
MNTATSYDSLSPRHRAFVDAYLDRGFNATEAYRSVYGCKTETAKANGHRLLTNADVRAAVTERLDAAAMDATETLARLSRVARNVGSDYLRADGTYDLDRLLSDGQADAIRCVKFDAQGRALVELHDAQAALRTLARVHGLFAPKKVEVTGMTDVSPERLADLRAKMKERAVRLADEG